MNTPADNDPSFEDTVACLKQTLYARPLCKELTDRREAAFAAMSVADKDAEVWKAVGRIEALDDLAQVLRPD